MSSDICGPSKSGGEQGKAILEPLDGVQAITELTMVVDCLYIKNEVVESFMNMCSCLKSTNSLLA